MRSSPLRPLAAALTLLAAGCSTSTTGGAETPTVTSVEPASGPRGVPTEITIHGTSFLIAGSQPSGGGSATVVLPRVFLDARELTPVTWVDASTLKVTVPADAEAGAHALSVENAFGLRSAPLAAAYTVATAGQLTATITADRPNANVSGSFSVTLTLKNAGTTAVTGLAFADPVIVSTDAGAATPSGAIPTPPASLAAGQEVTASWTFEATHEGKVSVNVTTTGTSGGQTVSATPAAPAQVTIQAPAAIAAALQIPLSVAINTDFTVTMTVTNSGGATARAVTPATPAVVAGSAGNAVLKTGTGAIPASADIAGGATATFTWTYTATAAGSLRLSAGATGRDANSDAALTAAAATSNATLVGRAAIEMVVKRPDTPTSANVTQPFNIVVNVRNPGTAAVNNFFVPAPSVAASSGPTPAPPATLPPGYNQDFTWRFIPTTPGILNVSFTALGIDSSTGQAIGGQTSATVVVTNPAALSLAQPADWAVSPATVSVNQDATVTLKLSNAAGNATANVTAVTPTPGTSCTPAAPAATVASPVAVPPGSSTTFVWTCRGTTAGPLQLGAAIAASDANTGAALAGSALPALTPLTLTVQAPSALTASWQTVPAAVNTGQAFEAVLQVTNNGGTQAVAVTPTAIAACTGTPAPANVTPTTPVPFRYTGCSGAAAGPLVLSASVAGRDSITNQAVVSNTTQATVAVQAPAALTAAWQTLPTALNVNQVFSAVLRVTNSGGAAATSVTPSAITSTSLAGCAAPAAQAVPGGGHTDFTYASCSFTAAGSRTLSASASGQDANTTQPVTTTAAAVSGTIAVSTGGALTATWLSLPTSVNVNQTFSTTLRVSNSGGTTVNAVTPSAITAAGISGCVVPGASAIPGGNFVDFPYTGCRFGSAGSPTVTASANGTDANSGQSVGAQASATITVNNAAVLTLAQPSADWVVSPATVSVNQNATVTLKLSNAAGNATANVTAITPTVTGAGGSCTAAAPAASVGSPVAIPGGGSATFTWSCRGTAGGSLQLGATVAAVDANTSTALTGAALPTLAPLTLTVQPAALTATAWGVSPSTVSVNQNATVTLTLSNAVGNATVAVTAVTPSVTGTGGSCTAAAPAASVGSPVAIPGGGSATFTWSCLGTAGGSLQLDATVAAVDATTSNPLAGSALPNVPALPLAVQVPASLSGAVIASPPTTRPVGQSVDLTLTLSNVANAHPATVTLVSPTTSAPGTATCTSATPSSPVGAFPVTINGGASRQFTWTCTASAAGQYTIGAGVTATDATAGTVLTVTPTTDNITFN